MVAMGMSRGARCCVAMVPARGRMGTIITTVTLGEQSGNV